MVWSDLGQDDVAADGPGLELDVVLALLRGSDALEVGADLAGDGVDVGPDRRTGRDPDADVAAGALGADPAAPGRADGEVAAAGGQRDVVVGGDDLEVAGAGLDDGAGVGGADLDVAGAGGDAQLLDAGADRDVARAALDPELGERLGDLDVAGAGVDRRGTGEGVAGDVARAGLEPGLGDLAVDVDVGAAGLDRELAVGRQGDVDVEVVVLAEEPAAALGADDPQLVALEGRPRPRRRPGPPPRRWWCRWWWRGCGPGPCRSRRSGRWAPGCRTGAAWFLLVWPRWSDQGVFCRGSGLGAVPGRDVVGGAPASEPAGHALVAASLRAAERDRRLRRTGCWRGRRRC